MIISLLKGSFLPEEAEELITKMVHVKIKYHENKISNDLLNEEDINMREKRIIELQRDLYEMRKQLKREKKRVELAAEIKL
jgi:sulfur transfer protein SufE